MADNGRSIVTRDLELEALRQQEEKMRLEIVQLKENIDKLVLYGWSSESNSVELTLYGSAYNNDLVERKLSYNSDYNLDTDSDSLTRENHLLLLIVHLRIIFLCILQYNLKLKLLQPVGRG